MKDLLGFELSLQMRGVGFWLALVALFLLGWGGTSFEWFTLTGDSGARIKADSPLALSGYGFLASVVAMFFAGVFVVNGLLRDETHKSTEVIHATRVSTPAMQGSRLAGVVSATALATGAILLGAFVGRFMPWADGEAMSDIGELGAVYWLGYAQSFLLFIVVNALFLCAVFALIAGFTRSRMAVYVAAILIFVVYLVGNGVVGGNEDLPKALRALVDPLGVNALGLDTRDWSPAEQNTRLLPLDGWFGLNRLVYGLGSLLAVIGAFTLFRRGIVARKGRKLFARKGADGGVDAVAPPLRPVRTAPAPFQAFGTRVRYEYLQTVRSVPFLVLMLVMVAMMGLGVWFAVANFVAERTLPTNSIIAGAAFAGAFLPLLLIVLFFSGDIVWREKTAGIHELVDSTRVGNLPLMAAKWVSMALVILSVILAIACAGMILQVLLGDVAVEPSTHFANGVTFLPRLLVLSAFVLFLQNFMPGRMVGMLVAGGAVAATIVVLPFLPFYHPLMNLGGITLGSFSELAGFSSLYTVGWPLVYWGGLATVFAVLTAWLWRRGTETRLRDRLAGLRERVRPVSAVVLAGGLAAFVVGGVGVYNAYERANYRTSAEGEELFVAYENTYADRFGKPVPKIRDVDVDVTFRPSSQTAEVRGTYRVENSTGAPVTELFVNYNEGDLKRDGAVSISVEGAEVERGSELLDYGMVRAEFGEPVAPGSFFDVEFAIGIAEPVLGDGSPVRGNGTFISNGRLFPSLGLRDARLQNPDKRRKYDLPELPLKPEQTDMEARRNNFFDPASDRVSFQTTFCTEEGQTPVAPGDVVREFTRDGLVCREFEASQPISNFFAFTSGEFAVGEGTYRRDDGSEVELRIFYDRQHDYNIDLMLDAMRTGLEVHEREFGRYPFGHLRIIEFPYGGFAQSFPGTVPFSENLGFVRDPGDREDGATTDLATYVTQHEIGHQWFGHMLLPADVRGFNILSETLSEHSARLAYEESYGPERARLLHERRNIRGYLQARAMDTDTEPALEDAEGQQYLFYNKGAWAMWGLSGYLGDEAVNDAIREVLAEYANRAGPYATSLDLVEALKRHAGPDYEGLVRDYWARITFWDLAATDVEVANGRVAFTLELDKTVAAGEDGAETSVTEMDGEALDEWVEVAFYASKPEDGSWYSWLAVERVRVAEAEARLEFELPSGATHMALDPQRLLIEKDFTDNVVALPDVESES